MNTQALRHLCAQLAAALRNLFTPQPPGRDELLAMGERELRDIAIGRGEIPFVLAGKR